jgi:integrase
MARRKLTQRTVESLRPAPKGKRYDVMDSVSDGFGVRVNDKGRRTFIFAGRFPGKPNYTRREIDGVGSLAEAREEADRWRKLIRQGVDPADEKRRRIQEQQLKRQNTFRAVFEDFRAQKLGTERKGAEVGQTIEKEFVAAWGDIPIADVTEDDVRALIRAKKAQAPAQARNMLGYVRRMFGWAIDERAYGLKINPCRELRAAKLIGKKKSRDRVLTDDELFAFWRATGRMAYPVGPVYRLLALTGLRLNEAADAVWPEFNSREETWTIPSARMKGKDDEAREHVVPVTADIYAILKSLPEFRTGKHLFSTTFGTSPVWVSDKVKKRLDARMLRTLKAMARRRGDDPAQVTLPGWVNHDLRRTLRTGLSRLRIDRDVREAVLAHARPGVEGVYDRYEYLDEKRDALERWAAHVWGIVTPAVTSNVVKLRLSAGAR